MRWNVVLRWVRLIAAAGLAIALASVVVAWLEGPMSVANASPVYIVAVTAVAFRFGIAGASLTAVIAVLTYDFFFTEPRYTFTVSDPEEWLHLVLLLFVAATVGQLAALERRRAETAISRERESRALYEITRLLATRSSTHAALPAIAQVITRDAALLSVSFALGPDDASERSVGSGGDLSKSPPASFSVLHGDAGGPDGWTRIRAVTTGRGRRARAVRHFRVRLTEGGRPIGSLWATLGPDEPAPSEPATRLMRVAADLVSQAIAHDRLDDERRMAEVARQSDALKSALLESVSHDLRTPLASIRASAGTLMDAALGLDATEIRASAESIDSEALRLNRLVSNLLELSRIEGGALRVQDEVLDLEDVVAGAVAAAQARSGHRSIEFEGSEGVIIGDPVLLEEALINLLDNAIQHTPQDSRIRVVISERSPEFQRVTIEDSGPGVPAEALAHLFERFYRVPASRGSRGGGMGIGLAIVRGFAEAMGGRVTARRSGLGGLAIDLDLRAASVRAPADDAP